MNIDKIKLPLGPQGWHYEDGILFYERGRFLFTLILWRHPMWGLGFTASRDIYATDLDITVGPILFAFLVDNE